MYKLILVVLALIAVASAQYIASPYAYNYGYRNYAGYGAVGYPAYTAYSGYNYPLAYNTFGAYNGVLYK